MNNIFTRIESLSTRGIIIDVVVVNQEENGYGLQVELGDVPLITYTVEVMNNKLDDMLYQESCDSFKEALEAGVKWAEGYNSEG